jgi:hypothetical protein
MASMNAIPAVSVRHNRHDGNVAPFVSLGHDRPDLQPVAPSGLRTSTQISAERDAAQVEREALEASRSDVLLNGSTSCPPEAEAGCRHRAQAHPGRAHRRLVGPEP